MRSWCPAANFQPLPSSAYATDAAPPDPVHRYAPLVTSVALPSGAISQRRELISASVPSRVAFRRSAGSPSSVKSAQIGKVHEVEAPLSGGAGLSRTQPPLLECCAAKAIGSVATPAAGSVGADKVACTVETYPRGGKATRPGAAPDAVALAYTWPARLSHLTICS